MAKDADNRSTGTSPRCPSSKAPGNPDPHALATAKAVQQVVTPDTVILFGSRARGDYHRQSDLDLMVVGDDTTAGLAERAAREYLKNHPPRMEVEIFKFTREEFARYRRAGQHIAGQAMHHGVFMSSERLNYQANYNNEYPEHWEATKQRLENTWKRLVSFNNKVDEEDWDQDMTGFTAQQSIENGLKGILSAHNCPETFRHDLNGIWEHYAQHHHDPQDTTLKAAVEDLLQYTTAADQDNPGDTINWLTSYAARYRYNGAPAIMTRWELEELKLRVNNAAEELIDTAHRSSGKAEHSAWPSIFPSPGKIGAQNTGRKRIRSPRTRNAAPARSGAEALKFF